MNSSGDSKPQATTISCRLSSVLDWKFATRCAFSGITSPRWRAGELVATPVGQVPVWQRRDWTQPSENMKARAALHQLAPSAAFIAMEDPENTFSDAASLTLSFRPVPIRALFT